MKKKIITHSGKFHPDDVFAVTFLTLLIEEPYEIIRTREPSVITEGDFVVDVGGIYDPDTNRFDHHQEGGAGKREDGIPYSSFGLVWKKYGERICGSQAVADVVEQKLVEPIDAMDNGVPLADLRFDTIRPYDIGAVIDSFSLGWEERRSFDELFKEVMDVTKKILQREILRARGVIKAQVYVEEGYSKAQDKRLIVLDSYYPWRDVLQNYPEPLFVVYPSDNGDWHVKTVPKDVYTFTNRKDLPKAWAGKTGSKFAKISGVSDAVFCHNNLFLAVAKSKEGALALAQKALEN